MVPTEGLQQMFVPGKSYFCLFGQGYAQKSTFDAATQ